MDFSFWERTHYLNNIDVAIVGGGFMGLNTAISLKNAHPGLKVRVFEKGRELLGASTKNAGFFCFGSLSEIIEDIDKNGEKKALELVQDRWNGLNRILDLSSIAPEFHVDQCGGYEIFTGEEGPQYIERLEEVNSLLKGIFGEPIFERRDLKLPEMGFKGVKFLVHNRFEGALDPVTAHQALEMKAREAGIDILYGYDLEDYQEGKDDVRLRFGNGYEIRASHLSLCTNGFTKNLLDDPGVVPARGQVLITKPLNEVPFKGTFHMDRGFYYFRDVGSRVLLGGGRELDLQNEETTEFGVNHKIQKKLEEVLSRFILPDVAYEVEQRWSGIMGFTADKTPWIGKFSQNISGGVGFSGMGVALTFCSGEKLANIISGTLDRYPSSPTP